MTVKLHGESRDVLEAVGKVDIQDTHASTELFQSEVDFWAAPLGLTYRVGKQGEETCGAGWRDFVVLTRGGCAIDPNAVVSVILSRTWSANAFAE